MVIAAEEAAKMSTGMTASQNHLPQHFQSQISQDGEENPAAPQPEIFYENPAEEKQQSSGVTDEPAVEPATEPAVQSLGEVIFIGDKEPSPVPALAMNAKQDYRAPISGTWQQSSDYIDHLLSSLNQQRAVAENCDFTVQIFGKGFPVHKCVLSAGTLTPQFII